MARKFVIFDIVVDIFRGEAGKRLDLQPPVQYLKRWNIGARAAVEALAARDPGIEALERAFERDRLAHLAAEIGIALVKSSIGIEIRNIAGVRLDRADT